MSSTEGKYGEGKFNHVALTVSDMQQALDFYIGLLGFELLSRSEGEASTQEAHSMGLPATDADGGVNTVEVWIGCGDAYMELFEYRKPLGKRVTRRPCDLGYGHFALWVDDIEAEHRRLREAGVQFLAEEALPCTPGSPLEGCRWLYLQDPDGNQVELIERRHEQSAALA